MSTYANVPDSVSASVTADWPPTPRAPGATITPAIFAAIATIDVKTRALLAQPIVVLPEAMLNSWQRYNVCRAATPAR